MHGSGLAGPAMASGTAALGQMPAMSIGPLRLDPPLHRVRGATGEATLEPKMMLVLVALAEEPGKVVTRQQLFGLGWAGTLVGDEALNRSIAGVRRALEMAGGGVRVETIPRTGYRLLVPAGKAQEAPAATPAPAPRADRRQWLIGAAGIVAMAGAGGWAVLRPRRAAAALVREGQLLLDSEPTLWHEAATRADRAIAMAPDMAGAWGLKSRALGERLLMLPQGDDPVTVRAALEEAASEALRLDPEQGDARAAVAVAEPFFGQWYACDRRVAAILAQAPEQRQAIFYREELLADVGRFADCRALLLPLADTRVPMRDAVRRLLHRDASIGDAAGAARWAALADRHWPADRSLLAAKARTFLYLGAPARALPLLQEAAQDPAAMFPPGVATALRDAAAAILAGDAARRADVAARAESVAASRISAAHLLMPMLSALGAVDAAFRVADALYRGRGPLALPITSPSGGATIYHQQIRRALPLFVPTAAGMRSDPRFWPLVHDIGLPSAWRAMAVTPDFLEDRSLPA